MTTQGVKIMRGFDRLNRRMLGQGELTDEHATSSYGQPVLLWHPDPYELGDVDPERGRQSPFIAYGPGDLPADLWLWREGPVEGAGMLRAWYVLRMQFGHRARE